MQIRSSASSLRRRACQDQPLNDQQVRYPGYPGNKGVGYIESVPRNLKQWQVYAQRHCSQGQCVAAIHPGTMRGYVPGTYMAIRVQGREKPADSQHGETEMPYETTI